MTVFLSWLPIFPSAADVQLWWMYGWCTRFFCCLLSITSNDLYIYLQKDVLFDIRLLMRLVYIYIMHRNCYFLIDDCFKCSVISEDLCEYVYCLAHLQCAEKWGGGGGGCMYVCVSVLVAVTAWKEMLPWSQKYIFGFNYFLCPFQCGSLVCVCVCVCVHVGLGGGRVHVYICGALACSCRKH